MSAEVIHHHFYHWVRGYWQTAEPYVAAWRKKEPARWEHLGELFETLQEIEVEIAENKVAPIEKWLDKKGIDDFFG